MGALGIETIVPRKQRKMKKTLFLLLLILKSWASADNLDELATHPSEQIRRNVERTQYLKKTIPSFSKASFHEKQVQLLTASAKAIDQQDVFRLADYPTAEGRPNIHFIYDAETLETFAVFKSGDFRLAEVLSWELGGIFGLDDVFTPSMPLILGGIPGELQIFQNDDVPTQLSYDEAMYPLVLFDSYLQCALGVLLFALEDMHNDNCYFQYCREGYIRMGLFDTLMAFRAPYFRPLHSNSDHPSLITPYNWIGWDFPQIDRKVKAKTQQRLLALVNSWEESIRDARRYFELGLAPLNLSVSDQTAIFKRAEQIRAIILHNPETTARLWHETLVPEFPTVEKKLKESAPAYKATWLLFRLQWCPARVYSEWILPKRRDHLKIWIQNFLQQANRDAP